MSLKHGILGLLSYGMMTGYDLSKVFDRSLNFFWQAQRSQIYRDLGNLEKKGMVSSKIVHQESSPDKKVYSITKEGEESLIKWINKYSIEESMKLRDPFLMRIFFSAKGDKDKLIEALKGYIKENEVQLKVLKGVEEEFTGGDSKKGQPDSVYWRMTMKKGYYQFKANIEWAEDILEELKEF